MTSSRKDLTILLCILSLTAFAFLPSLFNGFTNFDDDSHLWSNPSIINGYGVLSFFQTSVNKTYIPLTVLSFSLEHRLFGLNPFIYHLDNLLLHLTVTALIFFLGLRLGLTNWAAGLAALLFGVHPMHVEPVAWVTGRKDVLYSVFYLLALHSYWSYLKSRRIMPYLLTIVCGLLSILAKPMALSLPLVLFLFDRFSQRPLNRMMLIDKIPFFLIMIPLAWITYALNARMPITNIFEAPLVWIWSFSFYLHKFIFPWHLNPLYSLPQPVSLANPVYIFSLIIFVLTFAVIWRHRQNTWIVFAAGFYLLSIFFLLRFDDFDWTIVADRFMYLPSAGFCLLFGFAFEQLRTQWNRQKNDRGDIIVIIVMTIVFLALSAKTFFQTRIWNNGVSVWSTMIERNPNNAFLYHLRAQAFEARGQYDDALDDYTRTLELDNRHLMAYNNRGTILLRSGHLDEALGDFNAMIALNPSFAQSYSNRSFIFLARKNFEAALSDLNRALELDPSLMPLYGNRGLVHLEMKHYDDAIRDFSHVLEKFPDSAQWHYLRSVAHSQAGHIDQALIDAQTASTLGYPGLEQHIDMLKKSRQKSRE